MLQGIDPYDGGIEPCIELETKPMPFIELHDYYTKEPFILNTSQIEFVYPGTNDEGCTISRVHSDICRYVTESYETVKQALV